MSRSQSVLIVPIAIAIACGLVLAGCSAGKADAADPSAVSSVPAGPAEVAVPAAAVDSQMAKVAAQPEVAAQPAVAAPSAVTTSAAADTDRNLITAQGVGKVTGTPDVVTIALGVQTTSGSAQTALDDNNKLATDTIAVLKDNGVAPEDLQTSQLSVNPTYGDQSQITGYQVTNMVTAKLRDISKSGALIDAVGKSAGNAIRVQQLSFSIDDDSAARAAARADAVKRAQAQAKQLAEAAGVALGAVHSITEIATQNTPYYPAMDAAAGTASAAPPIEAGSIELNVTVQVVYEIAQ